MRHPRHGPPRRVLKAAFAALNKNALRLDAQSPIIDTAPLGPSRRRYANAAGIVATSLEPLAMLSALQEIESCFGRLRRGMRWGARVLDLDIVMWSGGPFAADGLVIPHPEFRRRAFVLRPSVMIAPEWRDPLTGLKLRHLQARLTRSEPLA